MSQDSDPLTTVLPLRLIIWLCEYRVYVNGHCVYVNRRPSGGPMVTNEAGILHKTGRLEEYLGTQQWGHLDRAV